MFLVFLAASISVSMEFQCPIRITDERVFTFPRDYRPLHDAISEKQSAQQIEQLITRNPSLVNTDRAGGRLPLHSAVGAEREDIVRLLLKHGADPNVRIEGDWAGRGMTPLEIAVVIKAVGATRAPLEGGADPNLKSVRGRTLDDIAIENETPEILQLLRKARDGRRPR